MASLSSKDYEIYHIYYTSERFNPLTYYRLYTTHFEHFNYVHPPQAIKPVAFILSKSKEVHYAKQNKKPG